ncbi:phosphoribosylanthranilate isomerase [Qipengyuania qiaonensis]|uniref:N-(5'-phosphoribosyl)anthranilate isomerase n=1 Tax=Qipengyuania qiaonensis TaxID=2867240 RepID=A0ABS7J7P0_9SPHN|nr:phosphoribosylanthranilate isomerase [Qipengyuania qiaonensis]MBX7481002.1 phosphoribosylanthranilate isomerase [Qipengyuania qiaonensis]
MPTTRIKICGITTPETLDAVLAARAEYVGFNFFPLSPRHIGPDMAASLASRAGTEIAKVGVFVDPDDALLGAAISAGRLDAIQLHGEETPERSAAIRARFALPVWKVVPVSNAGDVARAALYREAADFILFDAKTPRDATLPGGMGLRFDWSLLSGLRLALPWGLAGGLSAENVAQAIASTGAGLVDTSSGVESAPGVKDADRIAAFCNAVRAA